MSELRPAGLGPADTLRTGAAGLRARPVRAVLSALGIAIGIATMVAVIGISSSGREELLRRLDALGTGLLTVSAGRSLFGEESRLPEESVEMVRRIGPVQDAAATGGTGATVRRTGLIPEEVTGGIAVLAARPELLEVLGARPAEGVFPVDGGYPAVMLGSTAAERLGVRAPGVRVWIGDRWFSVTGVLRPVGLAPEVDRSVLVGWDAARRYLGFDGRPTTIYERSSDESVAAVRAVLARTVNPENPEEVEISRPSDALRAKAEASGALTGLLLGLGAVALLVGGVGVANTMVISVLERRKEIGLRRSLGATRGQIRAQFLVESLLLSLCGGLAGAVLGALATAGFAAWKGWPAVVPPWSLGAGLLATVLLGTAAGLYPAVRAARVSPAVALTA
ncbi:ABC transporter permease [Actinocorallia populi]|uniref:ABC transporter permease n=1 Tax=Actinocorallia populi TaxID=2079200 RepID=UPI000D08EE97|nr:ABC transporter permease [Actinocorallia populi]